MPCDLLAFPLWLSIGLLLCGAGWSLASRLFPSDTKLQRVGHSVLFVYAAIVGTGLVLGSLGLLHPVALLPAGAVVGLLALVGSRFGNGSGQDVPVGSAGAPLAPPSAVESTPWNVL